MDEVEETKSHYSEGGTRYVVGPDGEDIAESEKDPNRSINQEQPEEDEDKIQYAKLLSLVESRRKAKDSAVYDSKDWSFRGQFAHVLGPVQAESYTTEESDYIMQIKDISRDDLT